MTKAHLEQRLKDLQGNLKLMIELRDDIVSETNLIGLLNARIRNRESQIAFLQDRINTFDLTLVRVDNIFHEPIQFDVREEGGK
jgi:hypothetical protein